MERKPFLLSASRRTDIPAFYSEWLMCRLREGRAAFRHPYTRAATEVPLDPDRVAAIYFWTKDFSPLLPRLGEVERLGFGRYLVHYTITGLGPDWEPRVPAAKKSADTLAALSGRIGPERTIWRFDPVVLTETIGVERTLDRFEHLAAALSGKVRLSVVSIVQPYKKLNRRYRERAARGLEVPREALDHEYAELGQGLAERGRAFGISVLACCYPALVGFGVGKSSCVDGGKVLSLWPDCGLEPERAATRAGCGCHRSVDIGAYDTCPHMCAYCYANASEKTIAHRAGEHDPKSLSVAD